MSRTILALPVAILLAAPLAAQETVNDTVIAQIKTEGFQRSAVMDTLSWLSDVHGPRLTGPPRCGGRASGRAISSTAGA